MNFFIPSADSAGLICRSIRVVSVCQTCGVSFDVFVLYTSEFPLTIPIYKPIVLEEKTLVSTTLQQLLVRISGGMGKVIESSSGPVNVTKFLTDKNLRKNITFKIQVQNHNGHSTALVLPLPNRINAPAHPPADTYWQFIRTIIY